MSVWQSNSLIVQKRLEMGRTANKNKKNYAFPSHYRLMTTRYLSAKTKQCAPVSKMFSWTLKKIYQNIAIQPVQSKSLK